MKTPPKERVMADKRLERERRMYDALREISKSYMTPQQMRRNVEKSNGIDYEEMLEYAYENIQQLATLAIKGMRRPALANTTVRLRAPTVAEMDAEYWGWRPDNQRVNNAD